MKRFRLAVAQLGLFAALVAIAGDACAQTEAFSFAVISHAVRSAGNPSELASSIAATDGDNLAFVVVNGFKTREEPCSESLYGERKNLLESAKNGLIVSLAADDWANCRHQGDRTSASGHLNRLREILFLDDFSLGATRLPLVRQSTDPRYRAYVENARWEVGETMFATVNLPADNNHYVAAAGRNSEFEDRLVANEDWLHRVFVHAGRKRFTSIVLFSEGNPLAGSRRNAAHRDGFQETRRRIQTLASQFPGKVLVVYGDAAKSASPAIRWHGNVGLLNVSSETMKITATPASSAPFSLGHVQRQATVTD